MSQDQKDRIRNMVLSEKAYVVGLDSKVKVVSVTVFGTVFSGHPTRTTFGNTLRVIFYIRFACWLAGIVNYSLFVCGDDVLVMMDESDIESFLYWFYKVYTTDKDAPIHGLG